MSTLLNCLLSNAQHDFRQKKSTSSNLIAYFSDIIYILEKGGEVHAIYTDLKKEFDRVNID